MSTDNLETICLEYRDELLRLACGDVAEPSATLAAHLAECAACRDALADSSALAVSLRAALEPEPLPDRLLARIQARLDAGPIRERPAWTVSLRVAYTVAAAGLLAAVIVPWALRPAAPRTAGTATTGISLSEDDTSAIAAAIGVLRWDSTEYRVEALQKKVDGVAQTLEQGAKARTMLPWSRDDDWDVPAADAGQSALPTPALCAAANGAGSIAG